MDIAALLRVLTQAPYSLRYCRFSGYLRRRWFALEHVSRLSLANTKVAYLAARSGLGDFSLPEAGLVAGYAATAGCFLKQALQVYYVSPARAVGTLLCPAIATALLPITRHSLWVPTLGVPFERALAFHRATGSIAVVLVITHAAMMVKEHGQPILTDRAANLSGSGPAFGTAAGAGLVAMAVFASPPVRRNAWQLFKVTHLALMPTVMVLAIMHARMIMPYVLPPLLLWLIDTLFRVWVTARPYALMDAVCLPGDVVRFEVATHGRLPVAPGQYVLLQCPAISPYEWHPVSCICEPGLPNTVTFLQHAGGRKASFGVRFGAAAAAAKPPTLVRMDGAYGGPSLTLDDYAAVLLIAGGVGITPMISIAHSMTALIRSEEARNFFGRGKRRVKKSEKSERAADKPPKEQAAPASALKRKETRRIMDLSPPRSTALMEVALSDDGPAEEVDSSAAAEAGAQVKPRKTRRVKRVVEMRQPRRVLSLLWAVRHPDAPTRWLPGVLPKLAEGGRCNVRVHVTGEGFTDAETAGGTYAGVGVEVETGRPDLHAAVGESVARVFHELGAPPHRVAVLACGPDGLVNVARVAAAAHGCHFHAERFVL
jgi:ferredoxin-NADP reductase